MADFCRQCTIEYFGAEYADQNDMTGLQTKADDANDLVTPVLCEGCGWAAVDSAGTCIGTCAKEAHGSSQAA